MSKTVIVTGSSRGIGAATAMLFAEKGYNVVINYNNSFESAKLLTSSLRERGLSVIGMKADVSNLKEAEILIKETLYKFGSIDCLVNNAGISQIGLINDIGEYDSNRIFDVNLKGVYNCCKAVTPVMVNQKSGKIINVASMWGEVGASCEVAYSASKAGVIGLTKALAKELAPSNINVNAVSPGLIETSMNANISIDVLDSFVNDIPLGRIGEPIDVANAIYFLASDLSDYITGQVIDVNGGYII
ncbi:MAG: 3-oxoacyl-ACP reductase FabG [Clostridia bacterium]|nr:3-oxoacyl-ACP reductase FabG [Clostridia bacterium]